MSKFSILDLSPITQGSTATQALNNSLDLARHAEKLGFNRYWVAEHHNMRGIASAATSIVIAHIAGGTSTIRVGAGGIMLPNHSPLVIAEQFGTLASLFPGRIDLGIGRAPGTDQITAQALRRNLSGNIDHFPNDVVEVQYYFQDPEPNQRVIAVPGYGTNVPIWILGSSLYGAQLAAHLGLPYAFASHFAPEQMHHALAIYRENFEPSQQLQAPYVMLGFNICGADKQEQAEYLRTSGLQSYLNLRKGVPGQLPPPVKDLESKLDPLDQSILAQMKAPIAIGTREVVRDGMAAFIKETGADELMLVCSIFDHQARVHSFEIAADAAIELQGAPQASESLL